MNRLFAALVAAIVVIAIAASSMFTVDQRSAAIVFTLGEISREVSTPGLYFKLPRPLQTVAYVDRSLQTIDTDSATRYATTDKMGATVDVFAKWQIVDPKLFYVSFAGDMAACSDRLTQMIGAALNEELGQRSLRQIVSDQHDEVAEATLARVKADARQRYGVDILDVRLHRINPSPEVTEAIYHRMQTERTQVAASLRAAGDSEAERIKSDADMQAQVILAEANEKAQEVKGAGDAQAAQIYAEAYQRDPSFYAFYKSLEAYRASFNDKRDLLVLDPSSDFFRFLQNPDARGTLPPAGPKR